jgi:hypothetical protein
MNNFTTKLVTILTLLFVSLSFAQEKSTVTEDNCLNSDSISEKSLERGTKNYLAALQRDNIGAKESAITNIMIMKLYFPQRNYTEVISKLTELCTEGSTKQIRYKAYIACNYLKHPERYNWIKKDSFDVTKEFFNTFSEKLANQLENTEDSLLVVSN